MVLDTGCRDVSGETLDVAATTFSACAAAAAGNPAGSRPTTGAPRSKHTNVYTPGMKNVLELPTAAITHFGSRGSSIGGAEPATGDDGPTTGGDKQPGKASSRLVLCKDYDAAEGPASCPLGDACRFVHADASGAVARRGVHVNYAWRSADACIYARFRPGQRLSVAPPNGKTTSDIIAPHLVLKTRALQAKRRPLSHCAHYYFNRACNLGAECQFVHAVFIDPAARAFQLAPAPIQLGRVDHRDAVKRMEARRAQKHRPSAAATPHPASLPGTPADAYRDQLATEDDSSSCDGDIAHLMPASAGHGAANAIASTLPHPRIEVTMHHHEHDAAGAIPAALPMAAAAHDAAYLSVVSPRPGTGGSPTGHPATPPMWSWVPPHRSRTSSMASLNSNSAGGSFGAAARTPGGSFGARLAGSTPPPPLAAVPSANGSFGGASSLGEDPASTRLPAGALSSSFEPSTPLTPGTRFRRDPYSPTGTPVLIATPQP